MGDWGFTFSHVAGTDNVVIDSTSAHTGSRTIVYAPNTIYETGIATLRINNFSANAGTLDFWIKPYYENITVNIRKNGGAVLDSDTAAIGAFRHLTFTLPAFDSENLDIEVTVSGDFANVYLDDMIWTDS